MEQPAQGPGPKAAAARFGHYRLESLLGEGGGGRVYAAWDERLAREVAIKFATGDGDGDGLEREARRLASQTHPLFVRVFALERVDGRWAMVMERVHGRTLSQRLREDGPLPPQRALDYLAQAAEALERAHRSGWVHGDLKPSNLMLADDGRMRILDFGAAAPVDPLGTASLASGAQAIGTLAYLPPERLLGANASVQGDIYSLGLVLLEALGGRRDRSEPTLPAAAGSSSTLASPSLASSTLAVPLLDPRLRELIETMTQTRPQDRPASMARVYAQLRNARPPRAAPASSAWRRWSALALAPLLLLSADRFDPRRAGAGSAAAEPYRLIALAERRFADFDRDGALDESTAALDRVLAQQRDHAAAAALLGIAYCLRYAGDGRDRSWLQRADAATAQALRQDPQLALAQAARGWSEEFLGRKAQAERHYQRALALDPGDRYALLGLARLYAGWRRETEALSWLRKAIARYPRERWFRDTLGTVLYQQGDLAAAERAFRDSLRVKPDGLQAYISLSSVLLRQDRGDEALGVLQQGLRIAPHGRLYGNLGSILFARGRYGEAADAFERALSDADGSPNDYLKWANLADALRWLPGREAEANAAYAHALRMAQALLGERPDSATLNSRAALYAAKLGRAAESARWAGRALARGGDDREVRFRLGMAAELGGRRGDALTHLRRALALGYPPQLIDTEPDLRALRRDRDYHRILTGEPQ